MSEIFQSLKEATSGPGEELDLRGLTSEYTAHVFGESPQAILKGSLNGIDWYPLSDNLYDQPASRHLTGFLRVDVVFGTVSAIVAATGVSYTSSVYEMLGDVTAPTVSSRIDLRGVGRKFTMHVLGSGTNPGTVLEGSLDGKNWFTLATGYRPLDGQAVSADGRHMARYIRVNQWANPSGTVTAIVGIGEVL